MAISKEDLKPLAFHSGLIIFCLIYIYFGAIVFYSIERPLEENAFRTTSALIQDKIGMFIEKAEQIKNYSKSEAEFATKMNAEFDLYEMFIFDLIEDPQTFNVFESDLRDGSNYSHLWTMSSSFLLATTTIIPVGFGAVTPSTSWSRLLLVLYGIAGLPIALVTISDMGRFLCDFVFSVWKGATRSAIFTLITFVFAYPLIMGYLIWSFSSLSLADSYYCCIMSILTIGFGDILPPLPLPLIILFLFGGVMMLTVSVEIVGTNAIHNIHYMGRQMGKAGVLAGRFLQIAQMNINSGLGAGISQLNNLARMGLSSSPLPPTATVNPETSELLEEKAFEPHLSIDFVDFENDDGFVLSVFE